MSVVPWSISKSTSACVVTLYTIIFPITAEENNPLYHHENQILGIAQFINEAVIIIAKTVLSAVHWTYNIAKLKWHKLENRSWLIVYTATIKLPYASFSNIVKSFLSETFLSTQLKNYEIVTFAIRKIYTWNWFGCV